MYSQVCSFLHLSLFPAFDWHLIDGRHGCLKGVSDWMIQIPPADLSKIEKCRSSLSLPRVRWTNVGSWWSNFTHRNCQKWFKHLVSTFASMDTFFAFDVLFFFLRSRSYPGNLNSILWSDSMHSMHYVHLQ
jgi:hypothetical protein